MNVYQALEVMDEDLGTGTGVFHMTITYGNKTRPVGYCSDGMCNHKSQIEASDCYRRFCDETQRGLMGGFPQTSEYGTILHFKSNY